jgi:hypothetical protein
MTPSSADPSPPAALRACARGPYPLEAGAGLLISHACWLHRQDFQDEFIHAGISPADRVTDHRPRRPSPALQRRGGTDTPPGSKPRRRDTQVSLRNTLTGIDHRNIQLVITAVLHAWGKRPEPEIP